jgi:hypothetical protein
VQKARSGGRQASAPRLIRIAAVLFRRLGFASGRCSRLKFVAGSEAKMKPLIGSGSGVSAWLQHDLLATHLRPESR